MVKAVVTGVGTLPFFQPGQGCSDWVKVVEKTSSFSTLVKAVVTFAGQGCSDFNFGKVVKAVVILTWGGGGKLIMAVETG